MKKGIFLVCCLLLVGYCFVQGKQEIRKKNVIDEIEQYSLQKEALSTLYLAEILELSIDSPCAWGDLRRIFYAD